MFWKIALSFFFVAETFGFRSVFDEELHQNVLNEQLCYEQLTFLANNSLLFHFLDSSGKLPSGILSGNVNDLGDYYQCLSIDSHVQTNLTEYHMEGKYCTVYLPLNQEQPIVIPEIPEFPNVTWPFPNITLPEIPWPEEEETRRHLEESVRLQHWAQALAGVTSPREIRVQKDQNGNSRVFPIFSTPVFGPLMAVCVPKVCTARQAINFFQERSIIFNVTFTEHYCRLPNDKPFLAADYVGITIFSVLGGLAIVSSLIDLYYEFIVKKPQRNLVTCFSVYTNTRRILTFNSVPDSLDCVEGIRAISMMWVVVGHTYSMTWLGFIHNTTEALAWLRLFSSTWVSSSPLTVDTFFLLSGILVVYATVGKISRASLVRNIHLFYLNRLMRMFPLLATVVLLQASVLHHVSDGPFWNNVAQATENCRRYWWSALLHVQNYVNPVEICLAHSWYLSVDTQLYIVSPLVLVWLFGAKLFAWSSLCLMLMLSLVSASIYSFTYNFTAALVQPNRFAEFSDYIQTYYMNTLARAPPFFVGMVFGYLLHQYRGRKIRIAKLNVWVLWILTFVLMCLCVVSIYPVMQLDHEAQTLDNFLNAYMRTCWAIGLGWIIFACVHGYGGPVNWFLSLSMWKLPARLSYAMYLIHLPIMMVVNSSWVKSFYFTNGANLYRFSADLLLTFIAAFVLCVLVDAPFSTLQKVLMGGKKKPAPRQQTIESQGHLGDKEKTSF